MIHTSMIPAPGLPTHPIFYTVLDTATLLGVSRNKVYQLVNSGEIPCIRVGRQIRISRAALAQYLRMDMVQAS